MKTDSSLLIVRKERHLQMKHFKIQKKEFSQHWTNLKKRIIHQKLISIYKDSLNIQEQGL
jgi:hypothetical protein